MGHRATRAPSNLNVNPHNITNDFKPQRILVIGNAGAGKSTIAAALSEALHLPLVSLDRLVWRPGWKKAPRDEYRRDLDRIINQPAWVVDGVSSRLWEVADLVIFLDCSRRIS